MTPARTTTARAWWAVLSAVVAGSLLLDAPAFAARHAGEAGGAALAVRYLSYFTVQSNLLVLAASLPLARDPGHDGRVWRAVRLASLLGITVTGVVFAVVLAPLYRPAGVAWWTNLGLHYAAPLLALGGWAIFGPWGRTGGGTVVPALGWAALWTAWTLAHGAVTGWYPYAFLDAGAVGYPVALRNVAFVVGGAVGLLLVLRAVDRRLARAGP